MALQLAPGLLRLLACVYGVLAACSLFSVTHPRLRGPDKRAMRQAINGWWPSAITGGVAVVGGPWVALAAFAAVSLWLVREYLTLQRPEDRHSSSDAAAYVAVPVQFAAAASGSPALFLGASLAWGAFVVPAVRVAAGGSARASGAARLQLGLVWTVFVPSHVPWLLFARQLPGPVGNAGYLALLLVAVMSNDALQYALGKAFGRRPLAPELSPKKTWEGFAGGVLSSAAFTALLAPMVTPIACLPAFGLGVVLATLGTAGDLMVSALKRELKVKDSGQVLPGQGGLLDRCDSLIFTAPAYAHLVLMWMG